MPVPAETQPTLSFDKSEYTATQVGETFTVNLVITNVQNLWAWKVGVTWDPQRISLVGEPTEGNFLKQAGTTLYIVTPPKSGYIKEISCVEMTTTGASGSGILATFTFKVISQCVESPINLVNTTLLLPDVDPSTGTDHISHQVPQPTMTVSLSTGSGPVANAGSPQTVDEGTPVTLNGSKTLTGNQSATFTWRFFDGEPKELNGTIVNYTFDIPGIYNVTLTVQDSTGASSDDMVQITVRDITPPVPVITIDGQSIESSLTIPVGKRVTIDGSQSYDPEGGRIASYEWDTGGETNTTEQSFTYVYDKAGAYHISLTVFDQRGNNSATKTITIMASLSGGSGSQSNGQDGQNNNGSSSNNGTNADGDGGGPNGNDGQYQTFNLPPLTIGILATMTVITISGSAFWLRKRNNINA
jgi:PKD repeat protein